MRSALVCVLSELHYTYTYPFPSIRCLTGAWPDRFPGQTPADKGRRSFATWTGAWFTHPGPGQCEVRSSGSDESPERSGPRLCRGAPFSLALDALNGPESKHRVKHPASFPRRHTDIDGKRAVARAVNSGPDGAGRGCSSNRRLNHITSGGVADGDSGANGARGCPSLSSRWSDPASARSARPAQTCYRQGCQGRRNFA